MDTLLQQLSNASMNDIAEIREELVEQGYVRHRGKKLKQKKKNDKPKLTCYTSSEGIPIYVGKNNIQNEYLTNRLAQSSDTWRSQLGIQQVHMRQQSQKRLNLDKRFSPFSILLFLN
jgi:predicted ribosome quality control (RQC) complex YloA/Tae2 family protein